jgi:hypothetical protein
MANRQIELLKILAPIIGLMVLIISLAPIAFTFPASAKNVQMCEGGKVPVPVPDDFKIVCTSTWQFSGTCTGTEMWDKWKVTGKTNPDDSFIRPWLEQEIKVVGFELVKLQYDSGKPEVNAMNNHVSWFMIGSAIPNEPDAMIWLAPGETHAKQMWPAGMGQLWPDKNQKYENKNSGMIDLHGLCFGGGQVVIFLTIYYVSVTSNDDPSQPK